MTTRHAKLCSKNKSEGPLAKLTGAGGSGWFGNGCTSGGDGASCCLSSAWTSYCCWSGSYCCLGSCRVDHLWWTRLWGSFPINVHTPSSPFGERVLLHSLYFHALLVVISLPILRPFELPAICTQQTTKTNQWTTLWSIKYTYIVFCVI